MTYLSGFETHIGPSMPLVMYGLPGITEVLPRAPIPHGELWAVIHSDFTQSAGEGRAPMGGIGSRRCGNPPESRSELLFL